MIIFIYYLLVITTAGKKKNSEFIFIVSDCDVFLVGGAQDQQRKKIYGY